MASLEHIDGHTYEDKHVLPVGEQKRPWIEPLLRVVAVMFSLIGGFAITCLSLYNLDLKGWGFLMALLLGGICALLFRSWWAILFVPLALGLGELLAWYLSPLIVSIDPRFHTDNVALGVVFDAVFNIPGIAIIGIGIGSYLGTLWKKKQPL